MAFSRSSDDGATYKPWHYYVSSENTDTPPKSQCQEKFGKNLGSRPGFANNVICVVYPNVTAKAKNDIVSGLSFIFELSHLRSWGAHSTHGRGGGGGGGGGRGGGNGKTLLLRFLFN